MCVCPCVCVWVINIWITEECQWFFIFFYCTLDRVSQGVYLKYFMMTMLSFLQFVFIHSNRCTGLQLISITLNHSIERGLKYYCILLKIEWEWVRRRSERGRQSESEREKKFRNVVRCREIVLLTSCSYVILLSRYDIVSHLKDSLENFMYTCTPEVCFFFSLFSFISFFFLREDVCTESYDV